MLWVWWALIVLTFLQHVCVFCCVCSTLSAVSWILQCVICKLNYHFCSSINLSKEKKNLHNYVHVVNWPRAHWRAHHWEGDAGQGGEAHVDLRGLSELLGLVHDGTQSAGTHDAKHDEEGTADTGKVLWGILITIAVDMETNMSMSMRIWEIYEFLISTTISVSSLVELHICLVWADLIIMIKKTPIIIIT